MGRNKTIPPILGSVRPAYGVPGPAMWFNLVCIDLEPRAMVILDTLFAWLVDAGYLAGNPLSLARSRRGQPKPRITRYLGHEIWQAVKDTMEAMPGANDSATERDRLHGARCRWLFTVLYLGGLRAAEVAEIRMGAFFCRRDRDGMGRWWLEVTGKGNKTRLAPVTDELIVAETAPKRGLRSGLSARGQCATYNALMPSAPQPAISVLQLRISVRGLSPPVWRRVLVPEHLTLAQLRNVIQVVMGWTDEHLHQFTIRGKRYGEAHDGVRQFSTVANELTLAAFSLREHENFVYVYDFNAWWRHDVRVERRMLRHAPWPAATLRGRLRALPARGHWRDRAVSGDQGRTE